MKCTDIKSSHLKGVITIQTPTSTVNDYGIENIVWNNGKPIRGIIRTSSYKKREFMQSQGINSLDIKDVIIRFCNITHDCRIIHQGKQYKIVDIENLEEKNKYLMLTLECLNG